MAAELSLVADLQDEDTAPFYTIFAGLDANHDGNPLSDSVGLLGRGALKGDNYVSFDMRISRRIRLSERMRAEVIAEAFNLFNTLNVTEVNSVYGASGTHRPRAEEFRPTGGRAGRL